MSNLQPTQSVPPSDPSEVMDPKARRKTQNRLNQRACRRRKALQSQNSSQPPVRKWTIYVGSSGRVEQSQEPQSQPTENADPRGAYFCHLSLTGRQTILNGLEQHAHLGLQNCRLSCDMLLSVTRVNIIRAMFANAASMGLTMKLLAEDIVSPFNTAGPGTRASNLPPSLQPTALQKRIVHHPWIDLCPVPSIRDALLRNMHLYDEDELCHDMFGNGGESTGILIWGEAWDPIAYEVSEHTVQKWAWIWRECPDVIQSTNYWRLRRGDEPLLLLD